MPETMPLVRVAVAVAPVPPPPVMVTVGAMEYSVVPPAMVKLAALRPKVATAVAFPLRMTSGTVLCTPPAVVLIEATMPAAMLAAVALLLINAPPLLMPVPLTVMTSLAFC